MVAAEVVDSKATFPRALTLALGLTTALYLLPLAACSSSDFNWRQWGEGQFENLGIEFGGSLLGGALLLSSIVSMVGVMCTLVMTSSRAIAAMAQLRMLPPALARLHPVTGAPHLAVLLNAALIAFATVTLRFEALLELSVFYAINAIMQCAAVLRLRSTHPHRVRPRTILPAKLLLVPVGIAVLTLLLSPNGKLARRSRPTRWDFSRLRSHTLGKDCERPRPARRARVGACGRSRVALRVAERGDEEIIDQYNDEEEEEEEGVAGWAAASAAVNPHLDGPGMRAVGAAGVGGGGGVGGGYAHGMREAVLAGGGGGIEIDPHLQATRGNGDAWFGQLLAGVMYRRVPGREAAAADAVDAAFEVEMGELDDEVAAITKPAEEEAAFVGSRLVDHMLQQQQAQAEAEASAAAASSMILNEGEEYVTEVS